MLTPEQIAERRNYIGSTDSAAILGLSRYGTPLSVWAEKTGAIVPEDISGKLPVRLGHKLEQAVAELFTEETGKKLHRVNETVFHPKYNFLAANLDRRVVGEKAVVEIKNVGAFRRDEWREGQSPAEYICQVMHQLAVTGWDRGYLVALIGNTDFEIRTIERDEQALKDLVNREVSFWNDFVVPKIMPSISRGDKDTLSELFPLAEEGKEIELDDRAAALCDSLDGLRSDLKGLEGSIALAENELKAMLGTADAGIVGDRKIFWSNIFTRRLDAEDLKKEMPEIYEKFRKPSTYRKFLIKTNKPQEETNGHNK
jgi:putative phage-type endonuclease